VLLDVRGEVERVLADEPLGQFGVATLERFDDLHVVDDRSRRVDEGGRYRIPGVPPGDYRLVLWHDGREREVRAVQVTAGGMAEADFVVR